MFRARYLERTSFAGSVKNFLRENEMTAMFPLAYSDTEVFTLTYDP